MKSIILIAALSSLVAAQTAADIPSCATQCLADALSAAGCDPADSACSCGDARPAITDQATPCVLDACSIDEALMVQTITDGICANLPADDGAASSAVSSAASAASSIVSSAVSEAQSSAAATSEAMSSAMSTGGSATPTPSGSATGSAPPTQSTGAAAVNYLDSGLVAGALAIGAALL